jgi:cytochrome c553
MPPKSFRCATTATALTAPGFRPRFLTLPDNTRNIIAFELQMWKRGFRKSSPDAMALIAKQLDDQQLAPIAAYYQQVLTVPWFRSNS